MKTYKSEMNVYSWGVQSSNSSSQNVWGFAINPSSLSRIFTDDEIKQISVPLGIWFLTFITAIVGLVFIFDIKKPDYTPRGGFFGLFIIFQPVLNCVNRTNIYTSVAHITFLF